MCLGRVMESLFLIYLFFWIRLVDLEMIFFPSTCGNFPGERVLEVVGSICLRDLKLNYLIMLGSAKDLLLGYMISLMLGPRTTQCLTKSCMLSCFLQVVLIF